MEVEIYFNDLSKEKQKELLEAYGVDDPKEMNWDYFPVATIEVDQVEECAYDENGNYMGKPFPA